MFTTLASRWSWKKCISAHRSAFGGEAIALIQAGYKDHLLLSHDAGWYDPARPDGLPNEGYRGCTALAKDFIPALLERGITEEQVKHITVTNPAVAFSF